jgi:hypothetical protein
MRFDDELDVLSSKMLFDTVQIEIIELYTGDDITGHMTVLLFLIFQSKIHAFVLHH